LLLAIWLTCPKSVLHLLFTGLIFTELQRAGDISWYFGLVWYCFGSFWILIHYFWLCGGPLPDNLQYCNYFRSDYLESVLNWYALALWPNFLRGILIYVLNSIAVLDFDSDF
jgi:hypothetical protein